MKYSSGLRVVIVSGRPEVGKTTFENMCGRQLLKICVVELLVMRIAINVLLLIE